MSFGEIACLEMARNEYKDTGKLWWYANVYSI
jgi:hypothetical protein